jgi:hypothetical protein
MATYKNPEMRKSMQQMKEKSRKIKITGGSVSTREPLVTSSKRAGSMTQSGLPRTSKRGTPVAMPSKAGNIASGAKKTAMPKPTGKVTKKKTVITPRKRLDVSKMTPAQKRAYYNQPGYDNY